MKRTSFCRQAVAELVALGAKHFAVANTKFRPSIVTVLFWAWQDGGWRRRRWRGHLEDVSTPAADVFMALITGRRGRRRKKKKRRLAIIHEKRRYDDE